MKKAKHNPKEIIGFQSHFEDEESKNGWYGNGWYDSNGNAIDEAVYTLERVSVYDKYHNPIKALFTRIDA
jgi:hypothetical protein